MACRYLRPENNEPNSGQTYDFLELIEERSADASGDHYFILPFDSRLTLGLHVYHLNEQRTLLKRKHVDLVANYPWTLARYLLGSYTEVFQSCGIGIQQALVGDAYLALQRATFHAFGPCTPPILARRNESYPKIKNPTITRHLE